MRKTILWMVLGLSMTMAIPVYAGTSTYQTEVTNNIAVGNISIALEEFELDEQGNEIPYQNDKLVVPGQKVDKIVRITNQANEAWIRAKLEYTSEDGIKGLSDSMVTLASDDWKKCGDYYYYLGKVGNNEAIDFIKEVRIPTEWNETYDKKRFSIIASTDAVQTANFTPDFSSDEPWFGTIIETSVTSKYDPSDIGTQQFQVKFENGADGLVKTSDDFFKNWGTLMPGDVVTDTVELKNNYSRSVTMYFRTETIADDELLKAVKLEIKNGNETIYSGSMNGAITERVKIAFLRHGESAKLTYTLSVPAELTNKFALSHTKTKWIFTADLYTSSGGGGSSSGGGQTPDPGTTGPGVIKPDSPEPTVPDIVKPIINPIKEIIQNIPKLGDSNVVAIASMMMAISGIGILLLLIPFRKKDKKEERKNEK